MSECLVTTLKESVSDTSLLKLGQIRIHYDSTKGSSHNIEFSAGSGGLLIEIVGNGYFTDSTFTQNLGTTTSIQPNWVGILVYLSDGEYDIVITNKYNIGYRMIMISGCFTFDLDELAYTNRPFNNLTLYNSNLTGNIHSLIERSGSSLAYIQFANTAVEGTTSDLAQFTNVEQLHINGAKNIKGNISAMAGSINPSALSLQDTNLVGNIASFAGMTNLTSLSVSRTAITGDTSSLAGLTNLTTFYYTNTAITGTWPLT